MEYVLWGRKPQEPDWMEDVLFETKSKEDLNKAIKSFLSMGFIGLRVLNIDGSKPDFTGVINL